MNQPKDNKPRVGPIAIRILQVLFVAAGVVAIFYGTMVLARHHAEQPVEPDVHGVVTLLPRQAMLRGGLTLEPRMIEVQRSDFDYHFGRQLEDERNSRHIASWDSLDKNVSWCFHMPSKGQYNVEIEYACAADAAGGRYLLRLPDGKHELQTLDTGGWEQYRIVTVGPVVIAAGEQTLQIVPVEIPPTGLMHLRQVRLTPVPVP